MGLYREGWNVLEPDSGEGGTSRMYQTVHFEGVRFTSCGFHLIPLCFFFFSYQKPHPVLPRAAPQSPALIWPHLLPCHSPDAPHPPGWPASSHCPSAASPPSLCPKAPLHPEKTTLPLLARRSGATASPQLCWERLPPRGPAFVTPACHRQRATNQPLELTRFWAGSWILFQALQNLSKKHPLPRSSL